MRLTKTNYQIGAYDFETTDAVNGECVCSVCSPDYIGDDVKVFAAGLKIGNENYRKYHNVKDFLSYLKWYASHKLSGIGKMEVTAKKRAEHYNYCLLYAHNGGKFDAWFIYAELIHQYGAEIPENVCKDVLVQDGKILSMTLFNRVIIRDSARIFTTSLDSLCRDFNVEHQKATDLVEDYKTIHCNPNVWEYLEFDVLGLYECIEKMKEQDLDLTKMTASSMTIAEFKKIKDSDTIDKMQEIQEQIEELREQGNKEEARRLSNYKQRISQNTIFNNNFMGYNKETKKLEPLIDNAQFWRLKQSYYGGISTPNTLNVLNNKLEFENTMKIDINSSYPTQMRNYPMPYGKVTEVFGDTNRIKQIFNGMLDSYNKYYGVSITFKSISVKPGIVPMLHTPKGYKGKLGNFITKAENIRMDIPKYTLQMLKRHYDFEVEQYHYAWFCSEKLGMFNEFIDRYMQLKVDSKKQGNAVMTAYAKLLLNGLYGKFGQKPYNTSEVVAIQKGKLTTGLKLKEEYKEYEGLIKNELGASLYQNGEMMDFDIEEMIDYDEEARGVYLPVAICATDLARKYLVDMIDRIGHNNFIYADTDSIIFKETEDNKILSKLHKDNLLDPTELGCWDVETYKGKCKALRSKCYMEIKTKIPKGSTYEDMIANKVDTSITYNSVTVAGLMNGDNRILDFSQLEYGASFENAKLRREFVYSGVRLVDTNFSLNKQDSFTEQLRLLGLVNNKKATVKHIIERGRK